MLMTSQKKTLPSSGHSLNTQTMTLGHLIKISWTKKEANLKIKRLKKILNQSPNNQKAKIKDHRRESLKQKNN